jgi:hexosaminidase
MKNLFIVFGVFGLLSFFPYNIPQKNISASKNILPTTLSPSNINIIPQPTKLNVLTGSFTLTNQVKIYAEDAELRKVAQQLVNKLKAVDGTALSIANEMPNGIIKNGIIFMKSNDASLNTEGYRLTVTSDQITVISNTPQGAFYALQSLYQLLPADIFSPALLKRKATWRAPAVDIEDKPRFSYRGMHLDVSRNFQSVAFIKRYIDLMSMHKMNTFHWHLTDDQGWRIEIKKYPKLTEIGSKRKETIVGHNNDKPQKFDGIPVGGFYTQTQIKEVVAYATEHFVSVIPEIEMPGHALAALAAYPELSCDASKKYEVATHWGVFKDVFCPTDKTFSFLEDVLTEVIDLFPSKYIHVGGDECPKDAWKNSTFCQDLIKKEGLKDEHELQSYFIRRIEKFINSKGKSIIGWDEILEGGLAPNATVMSWRGIEGGIAAAKENHNVIMTPGSHCYFDYYQADPETEPLAIGGLLSLEKVYSYEPIPEALTEEQGKHILGAQANVWTEYLKTPSQIEYMTYPRLCALAEVDWSTKSSRNFDNFVNRLQEHFKRLDAFKVNAAKRILDVKMTFKTEPTPLKAGSVFLTTLSQNAQIRYTTDNSEPKATSNLYTKPLVLKDETTIKATVFQNGRPLSKMTQQTFYMSAAAGLKYTFTTKPNNTYESGDFGLTNGIRGNVKNYAQWVGFQGTDMEVIFDFETPIAFQNVSINFLNRPDAFIFLPDYAIVSVSNDGTEWQDINRSDFAHNRENERHIREAKLPFSEFTKPKRYLKVFAKNIGTCPKGHEGEGKAAWLFADEIVVEKRE